MNSFDLQYSTVTKRILKAGVRRGNRTGVGTLALPSAMLAINLEVGFPLLTLKRTPILSIATELEGFIKGITDKRWFAARGCRIWNEWCNPTKVPYGTDEASRVAMAEESDLGPIYGAQWRRFNGASDVEGGDQLENILDTLGQAPDSRRMLCSAWNPLQAADQALPPCHVLWQVLVIDGRLHLNWYQRSADWFLGVPFNVASYALLAHLIARHFHLQVGTLTGFFGDTHLYENQLSAAEEMLSRKSFDAPRLEILARHGPAGKTGVLEWEAVNGYRLANYQSHDPIKVDVVV